MNTSLIRRLVVATAVVALGALGSACGDDDGGGGAGMGAGGTGGTSGTGGNGGTSGTGGNGGTSGTAGTGGAGGTSGTGGDGGTAGTAGTGGDGGTAGTAGTGGAGGTSGTGDDGGTAGTGDDGGTAGTGDDGGTAGTGGAPEPCDPTENEVDVTANITADTTWECGTYMLRQFTYVTGDATLTIEPGVRVVGDVDAVGTTALIVTRGSKLEAVGTPEEPIVFTSSADSGARLPGDWGGVVLLGRARVNTGNCVGGTGGACTGGYFENAIEGLDSTLATSLYGGTDDEHDCGTIRYARIEFAGYRLSANNELNGLSVGACGSGTEISYLQVHRGSDDGIEFFGGTVGMDHVVISGVTDDSLDWDLGWTGKVQFLIIHQLTNDGDKGMEADNLGGNEEASPRSNPTLYNITLIGNPTEVAMHLREGTLGTFRNLIVTGFQAALNLSALTANLAAEWPSNLSIGDSVFFGNTAIGNSDSIDDDNGFNEDDAVRAAARRNVFDVDPGLGTTFGAANYKPTSAMLGGKATPPAGFDATATYAGAVDPAGADWTVGWTTYPAN